MTDGEPGRGRAAATHQHALLVGLGLGAVLLTALTLAVCFHALVFHEVPWAVQGVATVAGALALASLSLGLWRLGSLTAASRRLQRSLLLTPGPVVDGIALSLLADREPRAFCVGLLAPRIVVSQGALDTLEPDRLAAVVAHERHHARRRDGLRRIAAEAVTATTAVLPANPAARQRYDVLLELRADSAAVAGGQGVSALAGALLAFDGAGHGVEPERVDGLLRPGVPPEPVPGAVSQGALFLAVLAGLVDVLLAWTGCVDVLHVTGGTAPAERYEASFVVAGLAAALLTARAVVLRHGQ